MEKIQLIKKMVETDPANPNMWYLLGTEYSEKGMISDALNSFSEALKYCDDSLKKEVIGKLSSLIEFESGRNLPNKEDFNNVVTDDIGGGSEDSELTEFSSSDQEFIKGNVIRLTEIHHEGKKSEKKSGRDNDIITFEDVGGYEELKRTIEMRIIKPFANPGLFHKFKKKIGGGILLYGPPGCGKTYLARATAGQCKVEFISVGISDILDPYAGVSEQNIKNFFEKARMKRPCILFFDEIDTLGFNRAKHSLQYMRGVTDELLSQIDGIDTNTEKLLVFGATNTPWDVDSAFKRPGRFDRMIFVSPPDKAARISIFKLKLIGRPTDYLNLEYLSDITEFYSGADIENIVETAAEQVIADILNTGMDRNITMGDMLNAIQDIRPSTLEWLRTIKNYIRYANQSGLYDDVERYIVKHKKLI